MAKAKERMFPQSKIPEGFRRLETGNFPPVHDFTKAAELQGTVNSIKTVEVKTGRKVDKTRIMYVADENGVLVSVWESAALEGLFDEAKPGDEVYIQYTGPIKIKGRKQPMKGFQTAIRPASGATVRKGRSK